MTLKIPIQETVKLVGSLRFCCNDIGESMIISKREMVMDDEKIYVAVTGKYLESKSSLVWAIQNSGGHEFCIVHVHQPMQAGHDQKLRIYNKAHKNLDKYLNICRQMQVTAEKIYIEMDSVENGILQLISQRGVRRLVMGAAADRHCSMRMRDLQSKKAIYIRREAPATCHIWFTCNGYLICSREAKNSKKEARVEESKSEEAQRSAVDQIKRAKQTENGYPYELNNRKETEMALRKVKEELDKMRSESETRIAESNMLIRKLQEKYSLSMKVLRRLRIEKEELKMELREVSKLMSNRKNNEPPQYFICPITQDVMEDPHVAADGFTYEGEAISGWFERGHDTSPMTNKRLPHTSLVPNLALRSAIQEWLQAPK